MKRLYFLAIIGMLGMSSCSTDGDSDSAGAEANRFSYYITESKTTYDGENQSYHSKVRYNLKNGKMFNQIYTDLDTGYEETIQPYQYTNGLLTSVSWTYEGQTFTYDDQKRLTGMDTWIDVDGEDRHYRFVHISPTVVYSELLTVASTNPDAEIVTRIILQFDGDNNVIAGGFDENLDGVMDHVNQFTYEDGNLTSAVTWNGGVLTFSSSNVKNNFSVINDATYGKKTARLIGAYQYAADGYYPSELHSQNLRDYVFSEGEYEVLPTRYFKKSFHNGLFPGGSYESTTEFFFNYE